MKSKKHLKGKRKSSLGNAQSFTSFRKEEQYKRKENELKEKDLKIQESLIRFSKYLQENDLKKRKAEN